MNSIRSILTCAALGVLLTTISVDSHAAIPSIDLLPDDVEGYIKCIQTAYGSDSWHSTTIAECRASNPAVQALRQGDYVALNFTFAQNIAYNQAWKRATDFDKNLREQILSKGLPLKFNAAGARTAFSFKQVATELDARFSELEVPPFSYYHIEKLPYTTVDGQSLEQLHASELGQYSSCVKIISGVLGIQKATYQAFENKATACARNITKNNLNASAGLYKSEEFDRIAAEYWKVIASAQRAAQEAERLRLAAEEANSWPVRLKNLASQAFTILIFVAGLFVAFRFLKGPAMKSSGARYQPRRTDDEDDDEVEPQRAPRRSAKPSVAPVRERAAQPAPREDLGTFTLRHHKIGSPIMRHKCGGCRSWTGQRTAHPVNQDLYVKKGTVGKCIHKHPGSPHGITKYDAGSICRDFQDLGI